MVEDNLSWLEDQMVARAEAGRDTGFICGTASYTVCDLQLILTADFMGDKVNTAKVTPPFDARAAFDAPQDLWSQLMASRHMQSRMRAEAAASPYAQMFA